MGVLGMGLRIISAIFLAFVINFIFTPILVLFWGWFQLHHLKVFHWMLYHIDLFSWWKIAYTQHTSGVWFIQIIYWLYVSSQIHRAVIKFKQKEL